MQLIIIENRNILPCLNITPRDNVFRKKTDVSSLSKTGKYKVDLKSSKYIYIAHYKFVSLILSIRYKSFAWSVSNTTIVSDNNKSERPQKIFACCINYAMHQPQMGITRPPLPKNNGNLPFPFFGVNYPIVLLDNIY